MEIIKGIHLKCFSEYEKIKLCRFLVEIKIELTLINTDSVEVQSSKVSHS